MLTKLKGRSSTEEPREEDDTMVVEPEQNNGMAVKDGTT